ncbi:hypothetical protein [Moraxella oblonga]|uniref:hypothetical protein n=1 Tax=Moraxella oblonga TaxID=200413 RepID=UPI000835983C|nr:hypothetical protein [Moraxella oblonga]
MPHHSDTIQDWLVSNRLYEDNLFYYALIICFWFFWGFAFLGFELEGFSLQQNLFFNFIFYLFICTMMALCSVWFKLFFGKTHTAKREQELNAHLNELDDEDRQEVIDYLTQTGGLAMRPVQRWALVFLGSYFLFEVFFISAWVKDMVLVWQPDWVMGIVEWVRNHVIIRPLNVDGAIFSLKHGWVYKDFTDDYELIHSTDGETILFYHFIRVFFYIPVLTTFSILLWRPLLWLGVGNINPEHIDGFSSFIRACAWSIVMGFFFFMTWFGLVIIIGKFSFNVQSIVQWLSNFYLMVGFFFFNAMAIRFFSGWIVFWKQIIFRN